MWCEVPVCNKPIRNRDMSWSLAILVEVSFAVLGLRDRHVYKVKDRLVWKRNIIYIAFSDIRRKRHHTFKDLSIQLGKHVNVILR
jgi:hypothetical protein